jgi:hypothetical protein
MGPTSLPSDHEGFPPPANQQHRTGTRSFQGQEIPGSGQFDLDGALWWPKSPEAGSWKPSLFPEHQLEEAGDRRAHKQYEDPELRPGPELPEAVEMNLSVAKKM